MGIPVTPPFYHLWSMSLPQIELMMADRPVTVYPKKDRVEMGGGKFREFSRPDPRDIQEANDHWERLLAARKNH